MSEMIVLKLGGSVITDKQTPGVIDHLRLTSIAEMIADHRDKHLIIVHGAGSCGHPEAHHYTLQKGVTQENARGIAETHRAVATLNAAVVSALRQADLDAVGIHPFGGSLAEDGRLISFETDQFAMMATLGIIPVLHGDVVMDTVRGACVISGDQLVLHVASGVSAARVGLATDVPGVLEDGVVIPRIDRLTFGGFHLGDSRNVDVTGGMRGKVSELLTLADKGIQSSVFHIHRLADFLDGADHGGTDIIEVNV